MARGPGGRLNGWGMPGGGVPGCIAAMPEIVPGLRPGRIKPGSLLPGRFPPMPGCLGMFGRPVIALFPPVPGSLGMVVSPVTVLFAPKPERPDGSRDGYVTLPGRVEGIVVMPVTGRVEGIVVMPVTARVEGLVVMPVTVRRIFAVDGLKQRGVTRR